MSLKRYQQLILNAVLHIVEWFLTLFRIAKSLFPGTSVSRSSSSHSVIHLWWFKKDSHLMLKRTFHLPVRCEKVLPHQSVSNIKDGKLQVRFVLQVCVLPWTHILFSLFAHFHSKELCSLLSMNFSLFPHIFLKCISIEIIFL